ncbi:MAG: hypothetical protein WCO63_13865 [Bacteroidota bacterium]
MRLFPPGRLILLLFLIISVRLSAQTKIGDDPTTMHPGAILELQSTNKGLLLPRVELNSLTNWTLAGTPVAGMIIYNENGQLPQGLYYWDNAALKWVKLVVDTDLPGTTGGGTSTTSSEPWFKVGAHAPATSNTDDIYIMGKTGIGTKTPTNKLTVSDTADPIRLLGVEPSNDANVLTINTSGVVHQIDLSKIVNLMNIRTVIHDTLALSTDGTILVDAAQNNITITLPSATGNKGLRITFKNIAENDLHIVRIQTIPGETLDGSSGRTFALPWQGIVVQCNGVKWYIIGIF